MFKRLILPSVILLIAIAALLYWQPWQQSSTLEPTADNAFSNVLSEEDEGFDRAFKPREFSFPDDYGPHNRYRSEWWYFTGNLSDISGQRFGYELTFFRFALSPSSVKPFTEEKIPLSSWRTSQIYMAHLALTDAAAERFYHTERFGRAGNGLAGARNDRYQVWLYNWSASSEGGKDFPLHLQAQTDTFGIDLHLQAQKPLVLQGNQGLSQKSSEPGNASYYYSFTRLATAGTLTVAGKAFAVSGESWMDREWSSSALAAEQAGWDWFALQLSDNSELMFYRFRRKDGQPDNHSAGALFATNGIQLPLHYQDVDIDVLDTWTSPHSKITYPAHWRLSIPKLHIELDIMPLLNDQELNLSFRYWEGAVTVQGSRDSKTVAGRGYVELTGY